MKRQLSISDFEALNEKELQNTNGGIYLLIAFSLVSTVLVGAALYGAFMEGYNDGKAAALAN